LVFKTHAQNQANATEFTFNPQTNNPTHLQNTRNSSQASCDSIKTTHNL